MHAHSPNAGESTFQGNKDAVAPSNACLFTGKHFLSLKHTYHPTPLPLLLLSAVEEEIPSSSTDPFGPGDMWRVALARGICTRGRRCGICGKEGRRQGGIRL
jgi:hypothetical protein